MVSLPPKKNYWRVKGADDSSWNEETGDTFAVAPSDTDIEFLTVAPSAIATKSIASPPLDVMSLSPVIWYDAQDTNYLELDTTLASNASTLSISKILNKANSGTYDAVQTTNANKLRLGAEAMNFHYSFFNYGSNYHNTGYFPDGSAKSFAISLKMSQSLGTARAPFGCHDNLNHRFFVEIDATGKLIIGIGATTVTTANPVFAAGQQSILILTMDGTTFTAELDGVALWTNQAYTFAAASTVEMKFHSRTTGGATPASHFGSNGNNTGHIGEFILCNGVWNTVTKNRVYKYLQKRWSNRLKIKVILLMNQSNNAGVVADVADYTSAANEKPDPRILMMNRVVGAYNPATMYDSDVVPCMEPLKHWSVTNRATGPALAMAKAYLANETDPDVRLLLVPACYYSTGFSSNPNWNIGNSLANDAIARSNVAMSKTPASIEFFAIDIQGFEQDVGVYTQAAFTALFDGLINHLKANITGASNCRIVIGQMVPQKNGGTVTASEMDAPNRHPRCVFVASTGLSAVEASPNELHYNTPSYRILGQRKGTALRAIV